MTSVNLRYRRRARRTAFGLWYGPDYMLAQDENDPWNGFCVLRLALRQNTERRRVRIESRAAYAYLAHEEQREAVLRAVFWDNQITVGKSRDDTSPIKIPAKFVTIPVTQVQQWLHTFDGVSTSIRAFDRDDETLPVCSLRVETNDTNCVFEKVWQVVEGEESELNRVWQETWRQMGQSLQTAPIITGLEEFFPCVKVEPDSYDLEGYTPTLHLP